MDGMRPDPFLLDEVGGTAEAIDNTADILQEGDGCTVPGCGHWESEHIRGHCSMCHAVGHRHRAPYPGTRGQCLHYYFPPREDR